MAGYRQYGYQYETSPRKLDTYSETRTKVNKRSTSVKKAKQRANRKAQYNAKPIICIVLGFVMLFVISYRNSLINESYNKKEELKNQLSEVQKENEQLKVNIESSMNLNSVQKTAESELGMQKLTNGQKVYVNLQKKDYVEPTTEKVVINNNSSLVDKVLDSIKNIFK